MTLTKKFVMIGWILILNFVCPTLAFQIFNLDEMYTYYVIGGISGGAIVLLLVICCLCCRTKKVNRNRNPSRIGVDAIRKTPNQEQDIQKVQEQNLRIEPCPQISVPLPQVHAENERELTSAEHRRRLDAIVLSQAYAANNRVRSVSPYEPTTTHHDYSSQSGESGNCHRQVESSFRSYQRRLPDSEIYQPSSLTSGNRSMPPAPMVLIRNVYSNYHKDPENIISSFERIVSIKPNGPHSHMSHESEGIDRSSRETSADEKKIKPEFMGIKLKPIPLNRAGGTYIPPEDF